jgi:hypothetical protein
MLLCCALLVLVAGFGGRNEAGPSVDGVTIEVVRVVTYPASNPQPTLKDHYSLTCNPPTGTLPFAERICRNILEHPQAMLAPRDLLGSERCKIPVVSGRVTVTFTVTITQPNGYRTELRESPSCRDPGRVGRNIFAAATYGDEGILAVLERGLPCAEDPIARIFAKLTITNRQACMYGSWTDSNRELIRIAQQAPAIAALDPARLFLPDPGAQACTMPIAGTKGRSVKGQCGAYVTGAVVSFVEDWSGFPLIWGNSANGFFKVRKTSATTRHTWDVLVMNGKVKSVTERGAPAPQQRS